MLPSWEQYISAADIYHILGPGVCQSPKKSTHFMLYGTLYRDSQVDIAITLPCPLTLCRTGGCCSVVVLTELPASQDDCPKRKAQHA